MPQLSSTKDRILDAAERLFAERGYDATSLRSVTGEADANLAAAHYHFGGKIKLFQAVFERRVEHINRERLACLTELEAAPDAPTLEALLEAFLGPPLRYSASGGEGWKHFMTIVGRINSAGGEHVEAIKDVFQEVRDGFFPAFQRALPGVRPKELAWRLHFLIGTMCTLIADPERITMLSDGMCDTSDPEESLRQVIAFAAAGLRGPSPAPELRGVEETPR